MAGDVKRHEALWRSRRPQHRRQPSIRNVPAPRTNARPQPRPLEDEDRDDGEVSWFGLRTCTGIQVGIVPLSLLNISSPYKRQYER